MGQQITIIATILAALLTGGFLMIFIESHQVANNISERFYFIMRPFFHCFTNYVRFISLFKGCFFFEGTEINGYMKKLKDDLELLSKLGSKSILSGQEYPANYFTTEELDSICETINDIWYCIDRDYPAFKKIMFDTDYTEMLRKQTIGYLEEVSPKYKGMFLSKELLGQVSGEFYVECYQPVEHVLPEYEYWQRKERQFKTLSMGTIVITLISMLLLLFHCYIPIFVFTLLCFLCCGLLIFELYKLIRLEDLSKKIMR